MVLKNAVALNRTIIHFPTKASLKGTLKDQIKREGLHLLLLLFSKVSKGSAAGLPHSFLFKFQLTSGRLCVGLLK